MNTQHTATLCALRDALQQGATTAENAVNACLERIHQTEPTVQALVHIDGDNARETARALDAKGPSPQQPLWGVPLVLKDLLATRGAPTTCCSKMLHTFTPFYNAHVVDRLQAAGAIVLAKSNMDEFAMGSSTENSAVQLTKNPWNTSRVPGGSSGGSAAAVAAGQVPGALGTDTGGSIRQPAGFCGIVGLKPTYGRVSRYGLVAYGSSLDQIGPMTRSVADSAALLQTIAGHDPHDSTSVRAEVPDYTAALGQVADLSGWRIGVPREYWGEEGLSAEVNTTCRAVLEQARNLGAELVDVALPHTKYAIAAYYILVMAEASSNLSRFDGARYGWRAPEANSLMEMYSKSRSQGFGREVQRRILLGTYALSAGYYDAYYKKAAQVRRLIRDDYLQAFQSCDLLCAPVAPTTAFGLGEKTADPLQMYLTDIFTNPLNLTGLPGLSLPAGIGADTKMPVGVQLFAPAFGEPALLQAGHLLEQARGPLPEPTALAGL
ncbi:MAG: Asp-tRNA(Asn)/Glu-tRNA(Gln) amidotransferase subunit GatA [Thermodesulfobacteriota bacterium]